MTIYPVKSHGRQRWIVDWFVGGKRQRKKFKTKSLAENFAAASRAERQKHGDAWMGMWESERLDASLVLSEIRARGLTLREVWAGFQKNTGSCERRTVEAAITELLKSKESANRRSAYVYALGQALRHFSFGREQMMLDQVSRADVESWIQGAVALGAKATRQNRLNTFFQWAARRGYCSSNPCGGLDPITIEHAPPVILTPENAEKLMVETRRAYPRLLAWMSLGLFAGIRPQELDRLTWSAVNLDSGTVTIDAAAAKVRRRRIVHLMPAAVAWTKLAKSVGADLPLPHITRRRYIREMRSVIGAQTWPKDILRHTAASYWLAEWQDAGKVAHELGNSVGILLRHYRELVTREEAARFWGLIPKS